MKKEIIEFNPFRAKGLEIKNKATGLQIKNPENLQEANLIFKDCQSVLKEIEIGRKSLIAPMRDAVSQINDLAKKVAIPTEEAKLQLKEKILKYNQEQEKIRFEKAEKERKRLETIRLKEEADRKKREDEERIKREKEEARLEAIRVKQAKAQAKIDEEKNENKRKEAEIEQKRIDAQSKIEKDKLEIARKKRELEEDKKRLEEVKKENKRKELEKKQQEKREQEEKDNKVKGLRILFKYEIIDENLVPKSFCSPDSKKINEAIKNGVREIEGIKIFEEKAIR